MGTAFSLRYVPRGNITRIPAEVQSVVRESVKLRLGGWREVAASLGVNQSEATS